MPKICLNMIVKNEGKIIERLLLSVLPIVDTYCICDTGSTDKTVEIITTFFAKHNISGKIANEPFRDFGYNRSYALAQCNDMANVDYILLLDADMILQIDKDVNIQDWKNSLNRDAYTMFQGSDMFYYKNIRLLKKNPAVSYWGVTHEYVKLPANHTEELIEQSVIFINDVGDGGSKVDKFERDVQLLLNGLIAEPNNDRYTFYLANSYRDANQHQNAIDTYKKHIEIGGWKEEVWHSYYSIGKCYSRLNDMPNAIYYWLEGYQYYPDRIENLYEIVSYYRKNGKNDLACTFYDLAEYQLSRSTINDFLFLEKDIYEFRLDYEFTIFGYYCNYKNQDIVKKCMKVLVHPNIDESIVQNVLNNYKFYTSALKDSATSVSPNMLLLQDIGKTMNIDMNIFKSSTPSICTNNENTQMTVNVRYVNYKIDANGNYSNDEHIITKNIIAVFNIETPVWTKIKEFELGYDKSYDNLYVGIEDIRLFNHNGQILYNANRGFKDKIVVENGNIDIGSNQTASSLVLIDQQNNVEKNWVMFTNNNAKNGINMVYNWHPLTIGIHEDHPDKKKDEQNNPFTYLHVTHTIDTPPFFKHLRGSTNGITIGDEIWFICHVVSYEDRRYYYHIFVVLDSKTYQIKKYSKLFTFEKQKVEYTLGLVYFEKSNDFFIGYSVMDNETKYVTLPKSTIDKMIY